MTAMYRHNWRQGARERRTAAKWRRDRAGCNGTPPEIAAANKAGGDENKLI